MLGMNDRKLLVTGCSSGIGAAIVQKLLAEGAQVVGLARRAGQCAFGQGFSPYPVDLADIDTLPGRLEEISRAHPDIDGLILAAGYGDFGSLEEFSHQRIRRLVEVNLLSQLLIVRCFLPPLKRRGCGDIVLLGSEAALKGGRYGAVYAATKWALRGFAQSLRIECAARGVRVAMVNPGMVATPFYQGLGFAPGEEDSQHLRPEEVAEAVIWILKARPGCVIDEVNLSPLTHVVRKPRK